MLFSPTADAEIYYSLDGSDPTAESTLYIGSFTLSEETVLRAIAYKNGLQPSEIVSFNYDFFNEQPKPEFSLASGIYSESISLEISSVGPGAIVFYTVDGTEPSLSSAMYNTPILIEANMTVKAFAIRTGYKDSEVVTHTYGINMPAQPEDQPAPNFSTIGGIYTEAISLELSAEGAGATVFYTTDGSLPNEATTLYTGPIPIETTTTVKAFAVRTGFLDSDIVSHTFAMDLQLDEPSFSTTGGVYAETVAQFLELSHPRAGVKIYYSLDGTPPSDETLEYTAPIVLTTDTTVKAIAVLEAFGDSDIRTEVYDFQTHCQIGNWCHLFVTAVSHQGGQIGSAVGADFLCNIDSNKPNGANYKAMLTFGSERRACTTPNCSGGISESQDWVFKPERQYRRLDGLTVVGTTNSEAIFDFPLTNTFTPISAAHNTGLHPNWTNAANHCNNWTDTAATGAAGIIATDQQAINVGVPFECYLSFGLVCVEQP